MRTPERLVYKDGAVDIPHMGIALRAIFGAALNGHDIVSQGRLVNVTLNGVKIGQIQLKDSAVKGVHDAKIIRKDPPRL